MVSRDEGGHRVALRDRRRDVFELCEHVCGGLRRQVAELDDAAAGAPMSRVGPARPARPLDRHALPRRSRRLGRRRGRPRRLRARGSSTRCRAPAGRPPARSRSQARELDRPRVRRASSATALMVVVHSADKTVDRPGVPGRRRRRRATSSPPTRASPTVVAAAAGHVDLARRPHRRRPGRRRRATRTRWCARPTTSRTSSPRSAADGVEVEPDRRVRACGRTSTRPTRRR